jgi:glutathione S-transferase
MAYTLHGAWLSGPTYKAALMLTLCGQKWNYSHLDMRAGAHKLPEYLAKNRYGQAPCLEDGELSLCQSAAILEYLAEKHGKFGGKTPQEKARAREWMFWDFDRLAPFIYRPRAAARGIRQFPPDVLAAYKAEGDVGLAVLEGELKGKSFLVGNEATIADIEVFGTVWYATEAQVDLAKYPNISAWMGRVQALPGFKLPYDLLPKESRAAA